MNSDGDERREFRRVAAGRQPAYEITSVETAAAARDCLAEAHFDVVVADNRLPDGAGSDLVAAAHGTPLIVLASGPDEQRALQPAAGLDDVVARRPDRRHFDLLPITIEKAAYRSRLLEVESELSALQGFEAQFRGFFEHAAVGAAQLSVDSGRLIRVNENYCRIIGYGPEELLLLDPADLIEPGQRAQYRQQIERLRSGEQPAFHEELQMLRKDRTIAWVRINAAIVCDAGARPLFIAATFQDITDTRRREDAMRASESGFRAFMDRAPAIAWAKDADGQHVYLNQAYRDRFVGRGGDDRQPAGEPLRNDESDLLQSDRPVEELAEIVDSAGRHGWWWSLRFPFEDAEGRKYVGGVGLDVTQQERAREQLEAARRAAEDASRAKDQFLAVLSHELRTPLTPVVTGLALLQRDRSLSEQTQKYLEIIRRNVELESRLIDDLLDVSRIEHGKVELNRRHVDLRHILDRAVEVCRPDIDARNILFDDERAARRYVVDADAARLQQVFWNLLKNAIKFTPQGGRVGITTQEDGPTVVIDVTDSGIGIDQSALETIFRPFAQAAPSITRRFGGLGLGLSISKTLVEMHGGTIEALSHGVNAGSTFRVRLPLVAAAAVGSDGPPAERRRQQRHQHLRILLVEDHGDSAEMIVRLLRGQGHDVRTAGDAASALDAARQAPFDLVLSDLGLPDRSGLDLMRELRAAGCYQPSIAFSGYGQEDDLQQSFAAGFQAHLVKPIELRRLLQTVDAVMSTGVQNDGNQ